MSALVGEARTSFMLGQTVDVDSSNVQSIQYLCGDRALVVTFLSGKKRTYTYPDIHPQVAQELADADSKGKWVHQNLVATHHTFY